MRHHRWDAIFQEGFDEQRDEIPVMVFSMADLAIFWSLGICALPASDFASLTPQQYGSMRRAFGFSPYSECNEKHDCWSSFNRSGSTAAKSDFYAGSFQPGSVDTAASVIGGSVTDASAVYATDIDCTASVCCGSITEASACDATDIDLTASICCGSVTEATTFEAGAFYATEVDTVSVVCGGVTDATALDAGAVNTTDEFVTAIPLKSTATCGRAAVVVSEVDADDIHAAKKSDFPLTLGIPLWSPSAFQAEEIPEARQLLEQFVELEHRLDLIDFTVRVSQPTAATLDKLRFQLRFSAPMVISACVKEMLDAESFRPRHAAQNEMRPPVSYGTAFRRYLKTQRSGDANPFSEDQAQLLDDLLEAREDRVFAPLTQLMESTSDPLERTRLSVLSSLHRIHQEKFLQIMIRFEKDRHRGGSSDPSFHADLRQLLTLTSTIQKVQIDRSSSSPSRKSASTRKQAR